MQNRDAPLSLHLHVIHVHIFDGIKNMHLMPKKSKPGINTSNILSVSRSQTSEPSSCPRLFFAITS